MNPGTTPELLASLLEVRDTVSDYVRGLSVAQFTAGTDQRWSPAHHLDHLERSNAPVAAGLGLRERLPLAPREQPKRSFEQVQAAYRARLAGGARASGRFLPEPTNDMGTQLQRYRGTLEALHGQVQGWPDHELDARSMPHPVLDMLTVREMLYFTIEHNLHHLRGMQARLEHS
ncbi:hypothetical protein GCM10008955_19610 [Deinococcus malanensis]|uniref:DinB-like domain-containing protein n=1 Tax=Deinococcus malanensis TaxID=1706855 RepID=A0ABQ2EUT8_9DEIO|nr:DinB family protein [Deinococcus malanensis]GGK25937.1 hypothetical protein GCM10008955_19610 [Deinococcus malanensis]